jgi:L-asparaginase
MKRILIVFTGGTIGCTIQHATINVDASTVYYLIELFYKKTNSEVLFDTIQPLNILSENCTPRHWEELIRAISDKDMSDYAGVIVTHGSDTLPYTSALMGYLFSKLSVPVVMIASNYALDEPNSNGLNNFIAAVAFIQNAGLTGVYAIFENNRHDMIVYLPTRLLESDPVNDQFSSFGGAHLGLMKDGMFIRNEHRLNPDRNELLKAGPALELGSIMFDNEILAIKPYPGLNYEQFDLFRSKPAAILHGLYHSSTACVSGGKYSLPDFIKRCRGEGIDVYLTSFKNTEADLYVSSRELLQDGAIPLTNISFEAAAAKLWIAYNQQAVLPVEYMKQEIYFEFLKLQ